MRSRRNTFFAIKFRHVNCLTRSALRCERARHTFHGNVTIYAYNYGLVFGAITDYRNLRASFNSGMKFLMKKADYYFITVIISVIIIFVCNYDNY